MGIVTNVQKGENLERGQSLLHSTASPVYEQYIAMSVEAVIGGQGAIYVGHEEREDRSRHTAVGQPPGQSSIDNRDKPEKCTVIYLKHSA